MAVLSRRCPRPALLCRLTLQSLAIFFVFLLLGIGEVRANETEWLTQFGTQGYDDGTAIARHSTGIYVTGRQGALPGQQQTLNVSSGFVRRYDFSGNVVWSREFAFGIYGTEPFAIAVDDTGVYLAGRDEPGGGFVRKYDLDGNHLWSRQLYRPTDRLTTLVEAWGITVHSTGVYVVGNSAGDCTDSCLSNALVTRLDRAGNEIWTAVAGRPFDHPFGYRVDSRADSVAVDSTGVYVTGALGTADVRRYSFTGAPTGAFGAGSLWGAGVVLDASGIYLVGLPCPEACQFATSIRKYDRNGSELWNRDLPSEFESGSSIALEGDSIYVTGSLIHNFPNGPFHVYVRKYGTDGSFIWSDEFGADPGGNVGSGIAADASGVYVTGFTSGTFPGQSSTPNQDTFVIKRNEDTAARVRLLSLEDINHDGTSELAAVGHDAQKHVNWVVVKDATTRATIRKLTIADNLPAADVSTVPDLNDNGSPEIAILSATTLEADVRDSLSGASLSAISFDASFKPIRLATLPGQNGAGAPMLALLEEKNGTVRIEIRNALGGGLVRQIPYTSSQLFQPRDLAVLSDLNQNGAAEVAVLQRSTVSGTADKVEIRDSLTGTLIRNISFGMTGGQPVQLIVVPDVNGNAAPELAVLRKASTRVVMKDAQTGTMVSAIGYGEAYTPLKIAVVPDFSGNGVPELALLQAHPADDNVRIALYDIATGQWLGATYYGFTATVRPDDLAVIPDMNGNGVSELVRLGVRVNDSAAVAAIRDVLSGSVGGGIRFYP